MMEEVAVPVAYDGGHTPASSSSPVSEDETLACLVVEMGPNAKVRAAAAAARGGWGVVVGGERSLVVVPKVGSQGRNPKDCKGLPVEGKGGQHQG